MGLSLTINNNSGYDAYYLVWGFEPTSDIDNAPWSYLNSAGTLEAFPVPPRPPSQKDPATSKSILDTLQSVANGGSVTLDNIPHIESGSVFFSFKNKPAFFNTVPTWNLDGTPAKAHGGFGVQSPSFSPGSATANDIFCASEFTYLEAAQGQEGGIWADTTNVDYFTAPITIDLDGSSGKQTSGSLNAGVTRDDVFTAFSGIHSDSVVAAFAKLVVTDGAANIRVLAPGHGIESNLFPADYLDAYIQHCWSLYDSSNPMTIEITGSKYKGTYTASASGNTLTFYDSTSSPVGQIALGASGNSLAAFLCNGVFSAPNNLTGALVARVCAGINRTVLHQSAKQPLCNTTDFYSTADQKKSWWASNWYSNLLHENMTKTYGFPFDDVCSNDPQYKPLLYDADPTSVAFQLDSWT